MSQSTSEQLFDDDPSDLNTPEPTTADIIDAIQAPSDEISRQTDDQFSTELHPETISTNNISTNLLSPILNEDISLSIELIPNDANILPTMIEQVASFPEINETTAAELETDHVGISPINNAILFTSPTTVTNEYFNKTSTKKKRKKTWTQTNWIQDYLVLGEKLKQVDDLPEFQPPTSDIFHYEGQTVPLNVEYLSKLVLRSRGAFGSVFYGLIPGPPSIEIAAKRVPRSAVEEVNILNLVARGDHLNIVDYYCTLAEPNTDEIWICMEYMSASLYDVYRIMHQMSIDTDEQLDYFLRRVLHDCVAGLSYLERKGLVHRDIKPHNILINQYGIVKLCDFGISISLEELQLETTQEKGTELYIPFRRARDIRDDMWSLGLSLLEILDGQNPFASNEYNSGWNKCYFKPNISDRISPEMRCAIFHLLQDKPDDRPKSYDEILAWDCICDLSMQPLPEEIQFIQNILQWIPSVAPPIE